jgi:dTDP-4-amino-4,6-dideoxygalactose transaminase
VLENTSFILGPEVSHFEENFAAYCGVQHAVGVNSGTSALFLALSAFDIGRGDEVITAANTFVATVEAIIYTGATPVLIDIDEDTYNMDPDKIEAAITERTKAIMPVHLYGQPAEMDRIMDIAAARGLMVIEDAAQAHGAKYRGARTGSFGKCGCFSFYPGKNLGAYGEGGAIVTDDGELAEKLRMLRDHGQAKKYQHQVVGYNMRLEGFQGAVLDVKLRKLDEWNSARRNNAALYSSQLAESEVVTPKAPEHVEPVYHLYVIRTKKRDELQAHLQSKSIATGLHYPIPIHLQEGYAHLGYREGDFPVTERCAAEILSLPMFAELTGEEIAEVAREINAFL